MRIVHNGKLEAALSSDRRTEYRDPVNFQPSANRSPIHLIMKKITILGSGNMAAGLALTRRTPGR